MRRVSWYLSADAADAVDQAVNAITARLGPDTPRHVALSALLATVTQHTDDVAGRLLTDRAARLEAELAALKQQQD